MHFVLGLNVQMSSPAETTQGKEGRKERGKDGCLVCQSC